MRLCNFYGLHFGESMLVCGLGRSIRSLIDPQRFRTIGVNDIGRAFTPDYLFCMDGPAAFPAERLSFIRQSNAKYLFTFHDLEIDRGNVVRTPIRKSPYPRFDDPDALYQTGSSPTSPFLALCLAAHMGAKAIGLIGVDFTDGHFFAADGPHPLSRALPRIDERFYTLGIALLRRGVKIFNLSSESKLRAYPRLRLDEFYSLQVSGRPRSWTRPAKCVYVCSGLSPASPVVATARRINLETPVVCRVLGPQSPDIPAGSNPTIETMLVSHPNSTLRCSPEDLEKLASTRLNASFNLDRDSAIPCFGLSSPRSNNNYLRSTTLGVIVSQERASIWETATTVRSLSGDLTDADDLVVIARHPVKFQAVTSASKSKTRCVEQRGSETCAATRNRVAQACNRDILVFVDSNIDVENNWTRPLLDAFRSTRVGAVGSALVDMYQPALSGFGLRFSDAELSTEWLPRSGDRAYPVPLLPTVFLAVRRDVFLELGGFHSHMLPGGGEDIDLSYRLWTSGYDCLLIPHLKVAWLNPAMVRTAYAAESWPGVLRNLIRFALLHLGQQRLASFLRRVSAYTEFPRALSSVLMDWNIERRSQARKHQIHSDDWFFSRFPIPSSSRG